MKSQTKWNHKKIKITVRWCETKNKNFNVDFVDGVHVLMTFPLRTWLWEIGENRGWIMWSIKNPKACFLAGRSEYVHNDLRVLPVSLMICWWDRRGRPRGWLPVMVASCNGGNFRECGHKWCSFLSECQRWACSARYSVNMSQGNDFKLLASYWNVSCVLVLSGSNLLWEESGVDLTTGCGAVHLYFLSFSWSHYATVRICPG